MYYSCPPEVLTPVVEDEEDHVRELNAADPSNVCKTGAGIDEDKVGMEAQQFLANELEEQVTCCFPFSEELFPLDGRIL